MNHFKTQDANPAGKGGSVPKPETLNLTSGACAETHAPVFELTNPPDHLWRDKGTAPSGPLS